MKDLQSIDEDSNTSHTSLVSQKTEGPVEVIRARSRLIGFFILIFILIAIFIYCGRGCTLREERILSDAELNDKIFPEFYRAVDMTKVEEDVHLPLSVWPELYELEITPFIWEGVFKGQVSISVKILKNTNNITLNIRSLKISILEVYDKKDQEEIPVNETIIDADREFLILKFKDALEKDNQYKIHIQYAGYINTNLRGFYRSTYQIENGTRWIALTQLEPTDARQVFPCFDEPIFKARYMMKIARPRNMTTLSNMPVKNADVEKDDLPRGYVFDEYEESPPMSTYLVAFAIIDFTSLSKKNLQVWARRDAIDQIEYALSLGTKVLKFYEDYFSVKFALPKIDMIAVPDFGFEAMENWGLLTFRETALLYKEGVSTQLDKNDIAVTLAHELSHQWLGNLVTMAWWSDLWLNEGFATYMEYVAVDAVEPTWNSLDMFVVNELQYALFMDALNSSHPVHADVANPDEIADHFDGISYYKGAALIRMLDHFLPPDVFKQGLYSYFKQFGFSCAEKDDLWKVLTEEARSSSDEVQLEEPVKTIMDSWITQTGFPLVTVTRNYNNSDMFITQRRFFLNPEHYRANDTTLWWIPLTYTTNRDLDFNTPFGSSDRAHWMEASTHITIKDADVAKTDWVIFNVKQSGFYRVNYDEKNWKLLMRTLNNSARYKVIDSVNRAQIINDALNLAHAGVLNYSLALDLTYYLRHETELVPWLAAFDELKYMENLLKRTDLFDKYKKYVLYILENVYRNTAGFNENSDDEFLLTHKRMQVLNFACRLNYEDCVKNSVALFKAWQNTSLPDRNNPISSNLRVIVYCTSIRVGGKAEWEFAWQRYLKSDVSSEREKLLKALACTEDKKLLSKYLGLTLDPTSGLRTQDVGRIFCTISQNANGREIAWALIRDQWDRLNKALGNWVVFDVRSIISCVLADMYKDSEIKEIYDFAIAHKEEIFPVKRALWQAIERAQLNHQWMNSNYDVMASWLQDISNIIDKNRAPPTAEERLMEILANAKPARRKKKEKSSKSS